MGAPGFWDDQEERRAGRRRARARDSHGSRRSGPLASDVEDLEGLAELAPRTTRRWRPSSSRAAERGRGPARRARGAAPLRRPLRRAATRSSPCTPAPAAPTPRTGPRWSCAWRCAGPRSAASRSSCSRRARARRPASSRRPSACGRERLRALLGREGRPPARAAVAVRRRPPPPDELRRGRGLAGRRGRRRTSRSTTTICRSTPTAPPAPAASTSTRPTRRCASRTARPGSSCSARTSARSRPTSDTAMKMLRSKLVELEERRRARGDRAREGRGPGRQLRLADPLLRAAPVHDGQGPPHRRRDGRRRSACSTATSTAFVRDATCCATAAGRGVSASSSAWSRSRAEDVGAGDVTTAATVEGPPAARATVAQKAPGVVFGLDVAEEVFRELDPDVALERPRRRGRVARGRRGAGRGRARPRAAHRRAHGAELPRPPLGHRDGDGARGRRRSMAPGRRILDTRKTTPGCARSRRRRSRAGGGVNHRVGLYDAILIKENHIALAGGIGEAVRRARAAAPQLPLEVECRSSARSTRRSRPAPRGCCSTT